MATIPGVMCLPFHARVRARFVRALLSAILALQVCASFAAPRGDTSSVSTTPTVSDCCGDVPEAGCESFNVTMAAMDGCLQQCLQPTPLANGAAFFLTSIIAAHARLWMGDKVTFPPCTQRLATAPPASGSTPLIYHLQRLLN